MSGGRFAAAAAATLRADWQRWVGDVLLHNYLRQQQHVGGKNSSSSGGDGGSTLLSFSFVTGAVSVPADHQTMGYRLLRPAILRAAGQFSETAPGGSNLRVSAAWHRRRRPPCRPVLPCTALPCGVRC